MNVNRLTTPYDLHITLKHILNLSGEKKVPTKATGCRNCQSLLHEIPLVRSCGDVNIPNDSCPCSLETVSKWKLVTKYAARHAVSALNKKLKSMKAANGEACSTLKLANITSANQQLTDPWNLNYVIEFVVKPSNAKFEALMERTLPSLVTHPPQFNLLQEIVHVNKESEPNICIPKSQPSEKVVKRSKLFKSGEYFDF